MNNRELYYELLPIKVPDILESDWGVVLNSSIKKEIAIKIFEWKYGPQDIFSGMSIEPWQDNNTIKFNKGYYNGKISFSLDVEKISIFKIMITIVTFIIGDKQDTKTYIGAMQSLASVFQSAINVYMIKDDHHRCVYLKMIELSKNDPNIPIEVIKIKKLCNDDGSCCYSDIYNCSSFSKFEKACLANKENLIKDAIDELEKKCVIRTDNNGTICYIK